MKFRRVFLRSCRQQQDKGRSKPVVGLHPLAHIETVDLRHHHVEYDQVGPLLLDAGDRFFAIGRGENFHAFVFQFFEALLDEAADMGFVVADQDLPAHCRPPAGACRRGAGCALTATGRVKLNVLPLPNSLSTRIAPPRCSTISLQMASPRPVPLGLSVRVSPTCRNFSNTEARSSRAMPIPVSTTANSTRSRSEEHTSELQSLMRIPYAVFCLKNK